jgi:ATP adenylyltransferase
MRMISGCPLCVHVLQRQSGDPWDQAIAETPDYVIVPTKGALVAGWLLVVSREHVLCTGALHDQRRMSSLRSAIDVAKELVETRFGPATIFEHGPVMHGTPVGCGVDHLHIHVAPLPTSIRACAQELYPTTWNRIGAWDQLTAVHTAGVPYIAVQEPGDALYWAVAPSNVRQPLRRAAARAVGVEEQFDYNVHPQRENVIRTAGVLAAV